MSKKHPWRGVTFGKVAGFSTLLHACFSNCANGTKLHKASHSWIPPLYKGGVEFLKFSLKSGGQIFPIERVGLVK